MNLFIDLNKAVQVPNTGTDSKSGPQASRSYNESFDRTNSGVSGGDGSADDPNVGKKWKNSDSSSLDDELEVERKRDSEIAQERGIVAKDDTKKALNILKSFSTELAVQLSKSMPNDREIEYLTTVCGYDLSAIAKGEAGIYGHERSKFNNWLQERFSKSVAKLRAR